MKLLFAWLCSYWDSICLISLMVIFITWQFCYTDLFPRVVGMTIGTVLSIFFLNVGLIPFADTKFESFGRAVIFGFLVCMMTSFLFFIITHGG